MYERCKKNCYATSQLVHHFDEINLTMKGFPFREMTYKNISMMTSSNRGKKDS